MCVCVYVCVCVCVLVYIAYINSLIIYNLDFQQFK